MRQREAELVALWAAGAWRGQRLRAENDAALTVLYQGRRGGGAGPDFRDAVLARDDGSRVYGDVELHTRASAWRAHGHAGDARYDGVVLHAVLRVTGGERETRLASGASVPVVVLRAPDQPARATRPPAWPCAGLWSRLGSAGVRTLLEAAGQQRFEQRVEAYVAALACGGPSNVRAALWTAADRVLWVALAEGLGYGRDRAALRELGLGLVSGMPPDEALWRAERLGRVERVRARGLLALLQRWRVEGPMHALRCVLAVADAPARQRALLGALRVDGGVVSPARALILAANVALPFAVAVARTEGDAATHARAQEVFATLPGLPSNAITRTMREQLALPRLPGRARAHQGLQHLWAAHCREKRCADCPCALRSAYAPPSAS